MDSRTVDEEVRRVVMKTLLATIKSKSANCIDAGTLLKDNLGLDSLQLISIVTSLCEQLNVDITRFDDGDLIKILVVSDLVQLFSSARRFQERTD